MFGSNDDKKGPAAAGEKKGLFGWLRKKPQEPVVEQPQPIPEPTPALVIEEALAPTVLPVAEPVLQPVVEPDHVAEVVTQAPQAPIAQPWLTLPRKRKSHF